MADSPRPPLFRQLAQQIDISRHKTILHDVATGLGNFASTSRHRVIRSFLSPEKILVAVPLLRVVTILLFTQKNLSYQQPAQILKAIYVRKKLYLTAVEIPDTRPVMTTNKSTLRLIPAMLVIVAVIGLSTVATHTPAQNQTWLTLKNIRTDKATAFYAGNRTDRGAWFREMVIPTGDYADKTPGKGAWFREMVLPTGDSSVMTESLKSVAATL
jgi:hypothetical protein